MEMSAKRRSVQVAASVMCALVMLTLVADVRGQACSVTEVKDCLSAVTGNTKPSPLCCAEVLRSDFNCFCKLLLSNPSFEKFAGNIVKVPGECGGATYAKFKGKQCGKYIVP